MALFWPQTGVGRAIRAGLAALSLLLVSGTADARIETLRWTHPDDSSVVAFRIYVRTQDGAFASAIFEGLPAKVNGVFEHELDVPDDEPIVVAVSAIGGADAESSLSNQQIRDLNGVSGLGLSGLLVLRGGEKVKTPMANTGSITQDLTISYENGVWTSVDLDGNGMSGTYTVKYTTPLKIIFKLDRPSRKQLITHIHTRAEELSGFRFTAKPDKTPKLKLKLDDTETAGRIRAKFEIAEFDGAGLHTVAYILDVDANIDAMDF